MRTAQDMNILPEFTAEAFDVYIKRTYAEMKNYQKRGLHDKAKERINRLKLLNEIRDLAFVLQCNSTKLPKFLERQAE